MYEHTIGVPMIFAGPGIPVGKQFAGQAYLRDLFPTLCELAGLEIPDVDGKSQVSVLRGERESMYEFIIGYFRDSQRMIRTNRWKLIEYPLAGQTQLFDLESDPFELTNLADEPTHAKRRADLSKRLHQWLRNHDDSLVTNDGK